MPKENQFNRLPKLATDVPNDEGKILEFPVAHDGQWRLMHLESTVIAFSYGNTIANQDAAFRTVMPFKSGIWDLSELIKFRFAVNREHLVPLVTFTNTVAALPLIWNVNHILAQFEVGSPLPSVLRQCSNFLSVTNFFVGILNGEEYFIESPEPLDETQFFVAGTVGVPLTREMGARLQNRAELTFSVFKQFICVKGYKPGDPITALDLEEVAVSLGMRSQKNNQQLMLSPRGMPSRQCILLDARLGVDHQHKHIISVPSPQPTKEQCGVFISEWEARETAERIYASTASMQAIQSVEVGKHRGPSIRSLKKR